jgi:hypothetical protein
MVANAISTTLSVGAWFVRVHVPSFFFRSAIPNSTATRSERKAAHSPFSTLSHLGPTLAHVYHEDGGPLNPRQFPNPSDPWSTTNVESIVLYEPPFILIALPPPWNTLPRIVCPVATSSR